MYVERRPSDDNNPDKWAERLLRSNGLSWSRRALLRTDPRHALVRRYVQAPVLDAGCGWGDWVAFLQEQGLESWGLDYSTEMIDANRLAHPDCRWIHGTLQAIPLADATVGGIVSWGVIEHDPDGPAAAIREFLRVLRPGGAVIATVPVDSAGRRAASDALYAGGDVFFQHFFTQQELAEAFAREGFDVASTPACSRPNLALVWPRFVARHPRWLRVLQFPAVLLPRRYAHMIACVAVKPR